MSLPSPIDRAEATLFADGLGERVIAADATTGELLQILRLRPTLTAVPSFEFALRERTARLVNFRHAYYARVRRIDRVQANGSLAIVSDHVEGTRLSEILRVAYARGLQLDTNAALCLVRQLVPAVALLHENARDAAHGLIAPERIVVTPHARLVIVEHVAGSAVEQLQFGRERLWQDFRIALPSSAGLARFDHRADVNGIGVTALSLVLGRPIADDEFPHAIPSLLMQARERSAYGEERPLSNAFRNWLARTLQLDVRRAFASAPEALAALEETLASDSAYIAAPVALEMFLSQYMAAILDPYPIPSVTPSVAPPVQMVAGARGFETAPSRVSEPTVTRALESWTPEPTADAAPRPVVPKPSFEPAPSPVADPPSAASRASESWKAQFIIDTPSNPAGSRPSFDPPPAPAIPDREPAPHRAGQDSPKTTSTHSLQELPTLADLIPLGDLQQRFDRAPGADPSSIGPPEQTASPATRSYVFDDEDDSNPLSSLGDLDGLLPPLAQEQARADAAVEPPTTFAPPPLPAPRKRSRARLIAVVAAAVLIIGAGAFAARFYSGTEEAAPELGTLVVQSSPAGVEVFVDGEAQGMTPARVSLAAGSHILELRGRGVPRVIPFQLAAGGQVSQYLEFAESPVTGMLVVHSQPEGAKVAVDGVFRGVAPITIEGMSPGDHEVVLQNDAGSSKHAVKVLAGTTASLVAAVVPPTAEGPVSGWVSIKAPVTIEIYEGGKLLGTTDSDRLMMAAGRHVLQFVNETLGYRESRAVQVAPGKITPVTVQLPKGTINLNATPWAEVWIDGKRVGETPIGNLEVPLGPHEVVFRHPQLGEKRHAVSITAGAPVRLSVPMK